MQRSAHVSAGAATQGRTGDHRWCELLAIPASGRNPRRFAGLDNVDVLSSFPHGRVSDVQRRQIRRPPKHVHALALDGVSNNCSGASEGICSTITPSRDGVQLQGSTALTWGARAAQIVY